MANTPDSTDTIATERLDEVARILALGILRLIAKNNGRKPDNPNHLSEFRLDFPATRSVHGLEPEDDRECR